LAWEAFDLKEKKQLLPIPDAYEYGLTMENISLSAQKSSKSYYKASKKTGPF